MSSGVPRTHTNEEPFERSLANDLSWSGRIAFQGSGIGASRGIKREKKFRQTTVVSRSTQKDNFEGVLDSARATPCILWDESLRKAWLLPALSVLFFASLRYIKWNRYSFKSRNIDGRSEPATIHHAEESTDTLKAVEIAMRNNELLLADKANGLNVNCDISYGDIAKKMWYGMSIGEDVCLSDVTGCKYKIDGHIPEYDLNEAICGTRTYLRSLQIDKGMNPWQPLGHEKDVQVIFGRNIGDVVRCSSFDDRCCTQHYPKDGLSCIFDDLRKFYGECWHNGSDTLDQPLSVGPLLIARNYKLVSSSQGFVSQEEHRLCSKRLHSIRSAKLSKPSTKPSKWKLIRRVKNKIQAVEESDDNSELPLLSSALLAPTLVTFGYQ